MTNPSIVMLAPAAVALSRCASEKQYVFSEEPMTEQELPAPGAAPSAPILERKEYLAPSLFTAENMLREARRQKALPAATVPAVCVLDPDGDLLDYLQLTGQARLHPAWACYHTRLATFVQDGSPIGIIGRVVGAPFAVLVAEELFVSGCQLLISLTSAGQIVPLGPTPYVVLIDRALRDEGTSYHYQPPARYSLLQPALREVIESAWDHSRVSLHVGASWTTDAPFRETETAIAACRVEGIVAVEMEAAALYALAAAKQQSIVCFAHVTNQMAQSGNDFEKGPDQGSQTALEVIRQAVRACWPVRPVQLRS